MIGISWNTLLYVVVILIFQANIVSVVRSPADTNTSIEVIQDPEDIHSQLSPPPFPIHDDRKDWETWEASPDVVQGFQYYRMGYDLGGRAVYTFEFGKWHFRQWAQQSEEKVEEFRKHFEQAIRHEKKDAAKNGGAGIVQIIHWDVFRLGHHASPKVNFAAETFMNIARPFLAPYLEQFEINVGPKLRRHSSDWKPVPFKT